ncbi:MAG TPA: SDR family NAD(P)-dependent oxidoreductase, partial [Candidatus Polarisedimenticolia bacterium]|nr:SDR family NAD(P)-dependent oxidoreductase [Candidatus Polarisedimenticolia bacterium]
MSVAGDGRFRGQVAVITGGASGIGFKTASLLAREGAALVLVDLDAARTREAAAILKAEGAEPEPLALALDV